MDQKMRNIDIDRKLRICIVSREYPPETLWGGIGTFTYNLAHGLKRIGHDVDVLAFTFGPDADQYDDGIPVFRICSPSIPFSERTFWDLAGIALFPFSLLYSLKVKKKILELHIEKKYDVLDFPEHIGEGFFSVLSNRLPSLVRLYTPLSLIGNLGMRRSTNRLDYYLIGLLEKISIQRATAINSPSRNLADLVQKEFNVNRKIERIFNPIDTDTFSPNGNACRDSDNGINVSFVGRLEDRKGAHILAQAIPKVVKKCRGVRFTILGRDCDGVHGFSSMKDYMIHQLEKHGCADAIQFLKPVPYEELVAFYRMTDLLVVPSLYDNSPYTCLEAMSCGVPVLGTSAGGMPEYIDHEENGLIVPPGDPVALADALIGLVKDKNRRIFYGQRARDKAMRVFRREVVAERITRLYIETISTFPKNKTGSSPI